MARKPGNINPEGSGRGSMPALGRSSQSSSAAANKRAGAGKVAKDTLNWGRSVTFENPFKRLPKSPKAPKELDWGPRALFVRTKPFKAELDWGSRSITFKNPFKKGK
jgi:hypothetical protein